jgi:5-methyltetrahydrofolate--homocysteine methyltransferase
MLSFTDALHSGRVLLMDGAMGTELLRAGWPVGRGFERLNTENPEAVQAVHRAYAAAGAEAVLTNTFQAWRAELRAGENLGNVYARAIRLAREAAPQAFVLADVGPTPTPRARQVDDLLRGCRGADGILLETWSALGFAGHFAERQQRLLPGIPLLVSFTFRRETTGKPRTFVGATPTECAGAATAAGIAALGVNCGRDIGRDELLDIVRQYRAVTDVPLFVRPNAGTPQTPGGIPAHPRTPAEMAAWLPDLFEAGVFMVGGCCGTTPAHIAAFRNIVDEWNARTR